MVDEDPDFDDSEPEEQDETPEEDVTPKPRGRRKKTWREESPDEYAAYRAEHPLPDEPWGVPETEMYAELVDNGAPRKGDWWQHYFLKECDTQVCGAHVMGGNPETSKAPPEIIAMNKGRRCSKKSNLGANGRCVKHGGYSDFAGSLTHGGYSQVIGTLKQAAERATRQADIFDLRKFLILFDLRLENLSWRQADENGATPEQWKAAAHHYAEASAAKRAKETEKANHHWKELGLLLKSGKRYDDYWEKILSLAERRLQRTEAAQNLMIKSASMLAARDVRVFMHKMINILEDEAPASVTAAVCDRVSAELLARLPAGEEEAAQEQGPVLS